MTIRDLRDDDIAKAFDINQNAVPDVDAVDRDGFERLCAVSAIRLAALDDGELVGFCLVVAPDTRDLPRRATIAQARPDAAWHLERIAFARGGGGRGLGPRLFDAVDERLGALTEGAGDDSKALTSWFSIEPLNEHALEFYRSRGFVEVEQRRIDDHLLALMRRPWIG